MSAISVPQASKDFRSALRDLSRVNVSFTDFDGTGFDLHADAMERIEDVAPAFAYSQWYMSHLLGDCDPGYLTYAIQIFGRDSVTDVEMI